jgi:hypothetical protein
MALWMVSKTIDSDLDPLPLESGYLQGISLICKRLGWDLSSAQFFRTKGGANRPGWPKIPI